MLKLNNATIPVAPKDARVLAGPVPQVMDKMGSTLGKTSQNATEL